MKTITVAELRQNPTAVLAEVEAGETYVVTRHRHPVARLVPPETTPAIVPARSSGASRLTARTLDRAYSDAEVQALLAERSQDR